MAATTPQQSLEPCPLYLCDTCGHSSLKIFDNAPWVCLQDGCEQFFRAAGKLLDQAGDDGTGLRYLQSFLNLAESSRGEMKDLPHDLPQMFQPPSVSVDENGTLWGTEKKLRGGFVCPECACANAQLDWGLKDCRNCPFKQDSLLLPYPMDNIRQENEADFKKNQKKYGMTDGVTIYMAPDHVDKSTETMENGTQLFTYFIKNSEGEDTGSVVVERPGASSLKAFCGADNLLELIQKEGSRIGFKRYAARCADSMSFPQD